MTSLFSLAIEGRLTTFAVDTQKAIAAGATTAVERMQQRALIRLRGDVTSAGLGQRLANTWQAKRYPGGKPSMSAAALVYSKAPIIVQSLSQAETISAENGKFLALPTDNVPSVAGTSGSRPATVRDVELIYGKPVIKPGKNGNLLLFVNATAAKNGRGFKPTTTRRTKQGRATQLVLMFVLVRQVHLAKKLDYPAIFEDLAAEWETILGDEVAAALKD
jgi:hypothetical protein